jgi:hypothetical protein
MNQTVRYFIEFQLHVSVNSLSVSTEFMNVIFITTKLFQIVDTLGQFSDKILLKLPNSK